MPSKLKRSKFSDLDNSVRSKEIAAVAVHGDFLFIEGAEEALEEVCVFCFLRVEAPDMVCS